MKNDSVPRGQNAERENDLLGDNGEKFSECHKTTNKDVEKCLTEEKSADEKPQKSKDKGEKKRKKRNLWPLKALAISLVLSFAVNAGSELVLEDSQLWLASLLTVLILALGVLFDMIGTAATSCDVQPFLSMASRKVKGAKTAVKLAKNCDVVSSVCCDVVGDICGIVSGVCAATIAVKVTEAVANVSLDFWLSVLIYAVISTATITLKAMGKRLAVNKANGIVFNVAKILSVFSKD